MIDHLGIRCRSSAVSLPFYRGCLEPLGIRVVQEKPEFNAEIFMQEGSVTFVFIGEGEPEWQAQMAGKFRLHLAFRARSQAEVDAFHEAALKAGGTDNGGPGTRAVGLPEPTQRGTTCYSAFVIDPDGHNIEAIFHPDLPPF
ncbi:MAG: VOC family protein [Mycobacteriales bacterium]